MRLRTALAGLSLVTALATTGALSGCSPTGPGPCTHRYPVASMAILDGSNSVAARLTIHEDVCITPSGWIVSNTGSQEQHNVGAAGFFSGAALESHPVNDAAGPTGGWSAVRTFEATWTEDILYGVWGYGLSVGRGHCWVQGQMTSFGDNIVIRSASGYCTDFRTRVWG